jgi:hypothetical protein
MNTILGILRDGSRLLLLISPEIDLGRIQLRHGEFNCGRFDQKQCNNTRVGGKQSTTDYRPATTPALAAMIRESCRLRDLRLECTSLCHRPPAVPAPPAASPGCVS